MASSQNSLSSVELGCAPSPENMARLKSLMPRKVMLGVVKRPWSSIVAFEVPLLAMLVAMLAVSFLIRPDSGLRLIDLHGFTLPRFSFCPLLELTGIPCPFCGATRAFMSMGGLDLKGSFLFHPLGPVMFLFTAVSALYLGPSIALRRRLSITLSPRLKKVLLFTIGAVFVLAWPLKIYIWYRTGLL